MRGFFDRSDPSLGHVLLIESGPRETGELVLWRLHSTGAQCDVLTCYETAPNGLNAANGGTLLSVHSPEANTQRGQFLKRLATHPYDAVMILCPGSGVLSKWKWAIAARTVSRLGIADEYGDWFFVNYSNVGPMAVLLARRLNLSSIPFLLLALLKILIAPIVIGYLALYAAGVHIRRWLRTSKPLSS